ncbi:MAG: ATP-binding protein [Desulfonauticus sp.]|nr:ATP-binding protein [Desulfonauticus sp.]
MRLLRPDPSHPFQIARFLSFSSFVLILSTAIILVIFVSNYAREIFFKKDTDFALLLAENLNHQIFQRFTLPTILGYGRVELKNPEQYKRLEEVIMSTIHSFHVLEVRIYNNQGEVAYATNKTLLGQKILDKSILKKTIQQRQHIFVLEKKISNLKALFTLNFPPQTVVLKTIYPLVAERTFGLKQRPIMGILEFKQDISNDFESIVYFQWLIVILFIFSFSILFLLLRSIINRAEELLLEKLKEKEKLKTELLRTERLASMGRMVSAIAHEIRNPLGIIQSTSEFLFKKFQKENNAQAKFLKAIYEESTRLSRTVNDFLDYARPKEPKQETVDLKQLVQKVLSFLQQELKDKKISIQIEGENFTCMGDKDLLYRVFYNLILNSIQALEQNQDKEKWIKIFFKPTHKEVHILDSGPGFEDKMLEKYFEPFFTTKDHGTGLGLAIVKNILNNHEAEIILQNHSLGARTIIRF